MKLDEIAEQEEYRLTRKYYKKLSTPEEPAS